MDSQQEVQGTCWCLKILFAVVPFIAAFILHKYYVIYIRPKREMEFYRKQGIDCEFFPIVGRLAQYTDGVAKHGDSEYYYKSLNGKETHKLKCTNSGNDVSILLRDTNLIKEFCLNPDNYIKDPGYIDLQMDLMGEGLLVADGAIWKNQRKLITQAFHFEHLKAVMPVTRDTTRQILADVQKGSLKGVDIMDVFQDITGVMLGKIFFGEMLNSYTFEGVKLTSALAGLVAELGALGFSAERFYLGTTVLRMGIFPKHRKLFSRVKKFRNLCLEITREKRRLSELKKAEGSDRKDKDILEILFNYRDEQGNKIDDEQLVNQFITFFVAGMDTTGHLTTMAVYFLHVYPQYFPVMMKEVKENYKDGSDVSFDVLNSLEFTMCFLRECLRYVTPVPSLLPRMTVKDHKLGEFEIKKGTIIEVDLNYNNFHPNFFNDSQKFDPERWANGAKTSDAYAFIPFNAGQRNCIGQHFALFEARIILAEFLNMYDFKLVEPYELKMHSTFLYEPIDKITLDLTPKAK